MTRFLDIGDALDKNFCFDDLSIKLRNFSLNFFLIVASLILFAACSRITQAEGWSGGLLVDDPGGQKAKSLVIGSMDGHLLSINSENGKENWHSDLEVDKDDQDKKALYGTPALHKDVVFVGAYDGQIHAFSLRDGDLLESKKISNEIVGGPLIRDDVLYIGTGDGYIQALDLSIDGEEVFIDKKWRFNTGSKIWSTPEIYDDILIFSSLDHKIYGLDLKCQKCIDGNDPLWTFETEAAVASTPLVSDSGVVYIGSFDSVFYALDALSGLEKWRFTGATNWYWGKAIKNGRFIYAPSLDGSVYALDSGDGTLEWVSTKAEGAVVGSPVFVSGMLVHGSTDGKIYISDAETGDFLDDCPIDEKIETPIVADKNDVYFGARDHSIRALTIKANGSPDEKWNRPFSSKFEDEKNDVLEGPSDSLSESC